ncbi:alpha-L-fucosidase [Persicobacter psychrovividus]|uniref:alpha-L-fucosidase n=1 Tax=Persicobacter psychrovividus TaxID=387638 RepID=A0ABM7VMZ1_9BACT|nr:alpha-L-fucosidase [Persicobacter psychrovividus]
MRYFLSLILFFTGLILLPSCEEKKEQQALTYQPEWESLKQYQVPEWYKDMKFGIYFHWGPYSVPAHETEWYSHFMYEKGNPIREYHEKTYGPLNEFGYKDFIPMFTAEHFDADDWAELFKKSGAQFAGPVAEHADGFAMWDSELTPWNAKNMGPKRDIVGEMGEAIRKQGMKFITTYHRHWLFAWYSTWDEKTDASNKKYASLYGPKVPEGSFVMAVPPTPPLPDADFNQEWLDRLDEIMNKYQPDMIWFDNKMDFIDEKYRKEFLAHYYNNAEKWGKEVVTFYKGHDLEKGTGVLDLERSRMSEKKDFPWLTDDSMDWKAWCHISDPDYKSTNRMIDFLVDVVSKNGAVLLNIPPTADGRIPQEVRDRLLEIGDWFKINGEAIYGTRTWTVYGEGPQEIVEGHLSENQNPEATAEDIRFTQKDNHLYAITLDWPKEDLFIRTLGKNQQLLNKDIQQINLLGYDQPLKFEVEDEGLRIQLPDQKVGAHAFSFRITLQ